VFFLGEDSTTTHFCCLPFLGKGGIRVPAAGLEAPFFVLFLTLCPTICVGGFLSNVTRVDVPYVVGNFLVVVGFTVVVVISLLSEVVLRTLWGFGASSCAALV